jgi:hypothetical protein
MDVSGLSAIAAAPALAAPEIAIPAPRHEPATATPAANNPSPYWLKKESGIVLLACILSAALAIKPTEKRAATNEGTTMAAMMDNMNFFRNAIFFNVSDFLAKFLHPMNRLGQLYLRFWT